MKRFRIPALIGLMLFAGIVGAAIYDFAKPVWAELMPVELRQIVLPSLGQGQPPSNRTQHTPLPATDWQSQWGQEQTQVNQRERDRFERQQQLDQLARDRFSQRERDRWERQQEQSRIENEIYESEQRMNRRMDCLARDPAGWC